MDELQNISDNSWFAWSKHVLMQLESDSKCLYEIKRELTALKVEVQGLKKDIYYRSGIWGAIGGAIPVAIALAIWIMS